ncbi:MAG: CvpA family protein [Chthoniobacterales bacterium]
MTAGSSLWQTIFVSFALLFIAFEIVRGWRLGLVRQLIRLLALAAAYATAIFAGRFLLPVLRPFIRAPDFLISIVAGAIFAFVVYAVITAVGAILFKRTGHQRAGLVRLLYGLSGTILGIFFGLFSVWLIVVGVRSIGSVASADIHHDIAPPLEQSSTVRPVRVEKSAEPPPLVASLAKLKNSIELGSLGEVVKSADVVPASTYSALGKLGAVVSNPRSAERFLAFPGSQQLARNPKIIALRDDPEITRLIEQQRFMDLLQNSKIIQALNDPAFAAEVHRFDLQKALDYALQREQRP